MPLVVSPSEFLSTIWGDSQGFAELTAIGKHGVRSFPWVYPGPTDSLLAAAANHNKDSNVYMGVCLRREKWPRPAGRNGVDGKPIIEHRGTEANALSSWVVWVEFDFLSADGQGHKGRVVDPALARKWLAEFPLKPSIIVKSGGGIQVYWLLKEAAMGDDLWKVKAINKALVEFFTVEIEGKKYGADTQSVDLARILRIPGSQNVKYTPPRPCEVSWWRPDLRYILDDFEILPVKVEKPVLAPIPAVPATADGVQMPSGRAFPTTVLDEEVMATCVENVQALWVVGHKHEMALLVAGMFAHAGVSMESAVAVIQTVADRTGSDTPKRVKDVVDTYNNFVAGKDVRGKTAFEALINDIVPQESKAKALGRIKTIAKKLPKPPRPPANGGGGEDGEDGGGGQNGMGAEPDFHVTKLIKFDSRPARWSVTIRKTEGDEEFSCTVETINLMTFRLFQAYFFEQTHCMLMEITQRRWKILLGAAPIEVKETPKEARPEGAIETAMDEFLAEARENPDPGMLSSFPGYDEESRFFRFSAFKDLMKEQGIKIEDRVIFDHMKHMGFKNGVKRFGPKLVRVWIQALEGENGPQNGNGHGGGPADPPKPDAPVQGPPAQPEPEPELFPFSDEPKKQEDQSVQTAAIGAEETSDQTQDFGHE